MNNNAAAQKGIPFNLESHVDYTDGSVHSNYINNR